MGSSVHTARDALRLSVVEGMLHAVMLGASESYLGALAVELGHRDRALALLATVPLLAGACAQLASAWLTAAVGGRKRLVVAGASLQAATVAGFYALSAGDMRELAPFLTIKILFWVAGSTIMPAWGAWMADLTPGAGRSRYFAWRSAWVSVALVASFVLCGRWLHVHAAETLATYGQLFLVACVARGLSALALAAQLDPGGSVQGGAACGDRPAPLPEVLRGSHWQTALYMAGLMLATHVSTPFFTPYMLRELELDYGEFTTLMSVAIVAKAVVFPLCDPLAHRIGMRMLLLLAGLGVSATPALWWAARDASELMWVELLAGTVWAAWEYATFQLLLSASPDHLRLSFLSLSGTLTAAAQVAGALAGTWLIEELGMTYRGVFLVSAALRLGSLTLLLINLRALLPPTDRLRRLAVRLVTVRPNAGGVTRLLDSQPPPDP